jgi:signal transduction histidine kinase
VSDNGIGIEDQFQQQIFGLFQRLSNDTDGTGIGLALVKRIVEVHGGKVWVESEGLGTGTTLWFTLPCSASPEAQVSKEPVIAAN